MLIVYIIYIKKLNMAVEERVVESLCGEEGDNNGIWDM
jgi:hypothetical protein